jgi:hypothetical protein
MWISVRLITEESIVIVKRSDIAILLNPIHPTGSAGLKRRNNGRNDFPAF